MELKYHAAPGLSSSYFSVSIYVFVLSPLVKKRGRLITCDLHGRHRAAATSAFPEPYLHSNLPSFPFFHTIHISNTYSCDQRHAAQERYNLLMLDAFSCNRRDRILKFLEGSGAERQNLPNTALRPPPSLNFISFAQLTIISK